MIKFVAQGKEVKPYDYKGIAAIYKIVNSLTGKFYLGRATNLYSRITTHLSSLRRGVGHHAKSPLGYSWRKHGEDSFYVEIVEVVTPETVKDREQYYLDLWQPYKFGYNQDKASIGFTTDTAKKTIQNQIEKGRSFEGEDNGNAKLNWDLVRQIKEDYQKGETTTSLSTKYGVTTSHIAKILKGLVWNDESGNILRFNRLTSEQRERAYFLYTEENLSYSQIALILKCSKAAVGRAVRKHKAAFPIP